MTMQATINVLKWCGYRIHFRERGEDFSATFVKEGVRIRGPGCATLEAAISHAAGEVVRRDPFVARVLALHSLGALGTLRDEVKRFNEQSVG